MRGYHKLTEIEDFSIDQLRNLIKKKEIAELKKKNMKSNEQLIREFLDSLNSEATKRTYKHSLSLFIKFINKKNLQLVSKLDLEDYYNYLNNSHFKKQTNQLRYNAIVSFFKYFWHRQQIDTNKTWNLNFLENPVVDIKRKWKADREMKNIEILTNQEIKIILEDLKQINYRSYLMFYILADTSMRVNGLCNIEADNINFEKRIVLTYDKGKMRKYCFGENMKKELLNYLKIREKISSMNKRSKYLFFSKRKKKVTTGTFQSHIFPRISNLIKEKLGKKITAHNLRHSFKTNRTNMGQLREQIEALINHKYGLDENYNKPTDEMFLKWFDSHEEL